MDILEQILSGPSLYQEIEEIIDSGALSLLHDCLAKFRLQHPYLSLAPTLLYCIERQKPEIFLLLLKEDIRPNSSVVEEAARSEDLDFLPPLLHNGWPINQPLRNSAMPPLLW